MPLELKVAVSLELLLNGLVTWTLCLGTSKRLCSLFGYMMEILLMPSHKLNNTSYVLFNMKNKCFHRYMKQNNFSGLLSWMLWNVIILMGCVVCNMIVTHIFAEPGTSLFICGKLKCTCRQIVLGKILHIYIYIYMNEYIDIYTISLSNPCWLTRIWEIIHTQHRNTTRAQTAKFMGPTWGPLGSCRPQMGPMLAPWTLPSGRPIPKRCVSHAQTYPQLSKRSDPLNLAYIIGLYHRHWAWDKCMYRAAFLQKRIVIYKLCTFELYCLGLILRVEWQLCLSVGSIKNPLN